MTQESLLMPSETLTAHVAELTENLKAAKERLERITMDFQRERDAADRLIKAYSAALVALTTG